MDKRFAAFVVTYERAELLKSTIDLLLGQSRPPEKVLIIDNSESFSTRDLLNDLKIPSVSYLRMGYNAGPAGAARRGLELLAAEGYQWIYWGDDDNPPDFPDTFELLLNLTAKLNDPNLGLVGTVGQYFRRGSGTIRRVSDHELKEKEFISVDFIAGGQSMLINADLVRKGVLPDERLFFGFEELDYCLGAKRARYKLVVLSSLFLRARQKYGRVGLKPPFYSVKREGELKRQYYSTRNLLVILIKNRLFTAYAYQMIKGIAKAIYGFRYGMKYGIKNLRMITSGIIHSLVGRMGRVY